MALFLLLLYPGHWVHDEFYILKAVTEYQPVAWHGILSNIFYTYSLYIFPSAISIIVIQLLIVSLVVGWVLAVLYSNLQKRWLIILPILLFITIPTIMNNLYPLRLTLYSYMEFLLIIRVLFLLLGYRTIRNVAVDILITFALIAVVATWRTEGIYYILFIPFYLYVINIKHHYRQDRPKIAAALIVSCVFVILLAYLGSLNNVPKYRLTSTVGTLSNMLQYPLKGEGVDQKLDSVNKVFDLNILRQNPSYDEIPAFWMKNSLRGDYEKHIKEYNLAVLYIILHNPDVYLKVRLHTFLSTNAVGSSNTPMRFGSYIPDTELPQVIQAFNVDYPFVRPINLHLKYKLTSLFLQTNNGLKPGILAAFIWTVIPALLCLIVSILILAWKREINIAILLSFAVAHAFLIFATAPGNYFMYYFSLYLIGIFATITLLLGPIDTAINNHRKHS